MKNFNRTGFSSVIKAVNYLNFWAYFKKYKHIIEHNGNFLSTAQKQSTQKFEKNRPGPTYKYTYRVIKVNRYLQIMNLCTFLQW